jgi:hypothetical protein
MKRKPQLEAAWGLENVRVTARLVPRYIFMSASINVEVGGQQVFVTDGVYKLVGSQLHTFEHQGKNHTGEISWGRAKRAAFPVKLIIDGEPVLESTVRISNWWLMYWPFFLAHVLRCALTILELPKRRLNMTSPIPAESGVPS